MFSQRIARFSDCAGCALLRRGFVGQADWSDEALAKSDTPTANPALGALGHEKTLNYPKFRSIICLSWFAAPAATAASKPEPANNYGQNELFTDDTE